MQLIDLTEIQARIEAQQAVCEPTSPGRAPNALPPRLVETLWQLMGSMYGHRWTSSFGDVVDPDRVWAATLAGIDEAQIRHGMRQCVAQGYDWPPSAPEFRALCVGGSTWEHKRIEAADREHGQRLLEDSRRRDRDEAMAFAAMSGIRDLLGMPPRDAA